MIQESTIERVLDRLEAGGEDYAQELQDFAEAQPHLVAYLTNEEHALLTEEEQALLLFGALVIYEAVNDQLVAPAAVPEFAIGEAEERNFALLPEKGNFRDRLTPLFADSEEEELLAFAEDLLVPEEDGSGPGKEAREPIFIALKTTVDVLT